MLLIIVINKIQGSCIHLFLMACYSVQPTDWIFVKGYRLLPFARNMGRSNGKNISKNLSSKYSQKLLDHGKKSATHALKNCFKTSDSKNSKNNW